MAVTSFILGMGKRESHLLVDTMMKKDAERVLERINRERITSLLIEAVNSYSPPFAEAQVTQVLADALGEASIAYSLQPVPWTTGDESRANLIVQFGPAPLALLLVGHVDTVELWHEGEHGAHRDGDNLYGLGTADMKGGCAAMVEALIAVAEAGIRLRQGIGAAFVVGEEEYGDGAQALIANVRAPLTVIGEPTNLIPCTAHYGYLETRLVSNGHRAHAALPEAGSNAINAMLAWMMHIIEESQKLPFSQQLAVNPREVHGGAPYFVVADHCEAMIDFHIPPDVTYQEIENVIRSAQDAVQTTHRQVQLTHQHLLWAPGFRHHETDERLRPLRKAYEQAGLEWRPGDFRSHSDANVFNPTGTLTVVCGPGDLAVAHGRDEHISLSEVERAASLYGALICKAGRVE